MDKARKSTMIELVAELEKINSDGRFDQIIANAKSGRYHDYKNPDDVVCGKMELLKDLTVWVPKTISIMQDVKDGVYDEEADEEDKAMLRKDLPKGMWKALGL
jgi:hypothetical protein